MPDAVPPTWNTAGTMAWFLLFFVAMAYEIYAGIDHNAHTPMLTHVVCRYVPAPFTIAFILWLLVHFCVRYFSPTYMNWLKSIS